MKDPSLPSESEITLPKMLATGWWNVKIARGSERVKHCSSTCSDGDSVTEKKEDEEEEDVK